MSNVKSADDLRGKDARIEWLDFATEWLDIDERREILAEVRGGRIPTATEMENLEWAWRQDQTPNRRNAQGLLIIGQRAQRMEDDGQEALRRRKWYDQREDERGCEKVMEFVSSSPISRSSRAPRRREILEQLGLGY